jgi:hypothetical protein
MENLENFELEEVNEKILEKIISSEFDEPVFAGAPIYSLDKSFFGRIRDRIKNYILEKKDNFYKLTGW